MSISMRWVSSCMNCSRAIAVGNFEVPSRVNPRVSAEVDSVLNRALEQRPTARYQSVEEFRVALQGCNSWKTPEVARPVGSAAPRTVAVPFFCEGLKGWAMVHGTLRAQEDGIQIEYQSRDKVIGQIRSKLRVATVPWDRWCVSIFALASFMASSKSMAIPSASWKACLVPRRLLTSQHQKS